MVEIAIKMFKTAIRLQKICVKIFVRTGGV